VYRNIFGPKIVDVSENFGCYITMNSSTYTGQLVLLG
jgi:hypothetical protein